MAMARRKIGESLGETDPERAISKGYVLFRDQFSVDTPLDELLDKTRAFVATWEWSE